MSDRLLQRYATPAGWLSLVVDLQFSGSADKSGSIGTLTRAKNSSSGSSPQLPD